MNKPNLEGLRRMFVANRRPHKESVTNHESSQTTQALLGNAYHAIHQIHSLKPDEWDLLNQEVILWGDRGDLLDALKIIQYAIDITGLDTDN
ncbi:hypothetical protein [Calothrix sp. UHCC 0171]|uniref:hypothetical protein n=1 Tax=Calothrix sp. UHCC 0171 TaxID=3110245 RepID=UPI002B1EC1CF|nr:hypothetical protein [Calothrix sp. UHCC 0171]MEA5574058.1 hypothetical protein [Calothrix sp. UHCC 0171]